MRRPERSPCLPFEGRRGGASLPSPRGPAGLPCLPLEGRSGLSAFPLKAGAASPFSLLQARASGTGSSRFPAPAEASFRPAGRSAAGAASATCRYSLTRAKAAFGAWPCGPSGKTGPWLQARQGLGQAAFRPLPEASRGSRKDSGAVPAAETPQELSEPCQRRNPQSSLWEPCRRRNPRRRLWSWSHAGGVNPAGAAGYQGPAGDSGSGGALGGKGRFKEGDKRTGEGGSARGKALTAAAPRYLSTNLPCSSTW
jgi:hypothetical protein